MIKQCPECNNEYLTIRTDIYKDKREFIYCDCCGFILQEKSWHLVYSAKEAENIRKANLHCVDMFNMLKADYDKLEAKLTQLAEQEPVAYLMTRKDGTTDLQANPYWDNAASMQSLFLAPGAAPKDNKDAMYYKTWLGGF